MVKAPKGAPNVVIVLIDDMGFGVPGSTFGGPVPMPTLDNLAQNGLRYNNFHTTALCSPTRAALKSGRNHHTVNMGFITEWRPAFPGCHRQIPTPRPRWPRCCASTATARRPSASGTRPPPGKPALPAPSTAGRRARASTSSTASSAAKPTSGRPSSTTARQVELPNDPNYHFMTDMTDKAVAWIKYQKALTPEKPSFVYFAPGATHAPHHVPKEWIAKWKGKFDQGWDKLREETLARQIKLGVVPPGTKLAPKPPGSRTGTRSRLTRSACSPVRPRSSRRLPITPTTRSAACSRPSKRIGQADNTLVFYIAGDNGTSGEGGQNGMFNEYTYFNGVPRRSRTCSNSPTSGAAPRPTRTWRPAGRSRSMLRSAG
jgi:arylsulfatase A-like enzyme